MTVDRQMAKKLWGVCVGVCVYTNNEILLSHKKQNLVICNNLDEPRGYYAK